VSDNYASAPPSRDRGRHRLVKPSRVAALGVVVAAGVGAIASTAGAAKPAAAPGFKLTKLAAMPAGVTNCDDIATLGTVDYTQIKIPVGHLFVGCSNGVLSDGSAGSSNSNADSSTLVEYTTAGKYVKQWSVADEIAGMAAEPLHRRILMPLNSSSNSEFVFLDPNIAGSFAEIQYAYSPDPASTSAASSLYTGGGTESVVVDSKDDIYVTASDPKTPGATATFKVVLSPPSGPPPAKGAATLTPTFSDDATAANGNTGKGTVKLALREIDANAIVPTSSGKYGGDYVVDDTATHQLVFSSDVSAGTGLTVLKTTDGLNDIRWATSSGGTFYLVSHGTQTPKGKSTLYKVTGSFVKGDAYATTTNGDLVRVDLSNGKLTTLVSGIGTSVGLLYVNSDGTTTQLAVNGS
jgi:hypothetical protein